MGTYKWDICKDIKKKISSVFKKKDSFIKISVVIPTYNTDPDALIRLINSIDKQTMPKDEYEMIFVDDGSTTDIVATLEELAVSRSNVKLKRIPNSGWGSKPRNIGTQIARGYYILYMDHDDVVFPEAFERVYKYGRKHHADVVNPKEVRTNGWSWGWDQFKENVPSAEKYGIQFLIPMTPHKFYKREFLLKNQIEFIEGERVLWEDVYFNTKVFTSGASVAVLASYPAYYWIATGANNFDTFERDPHERWRNTNKLFTFFVESISNEEALTFMLSHRYQSDILRIFGPGLLDKSDERISIEFNYARKVINQFIPISIDQNVTAINKIRAFLLRKGKLEELKKLAKHDKEVTARSYATDIKWVNGELIIDATAKMTFNEESPFLLHLKGGRIFRKIQDDLQPIIPKELLDLTDDMDNLSYEASIKGRNSRVIWRIPVDYSEVKTEQISPSEGTLIGHLKVNFNIQKAAMGEPLDKQPWDIATRFSAFGFISHRGIVAPKGLGLAALINGTTAVAYCNKSNLLSVDIGSHVRSIVGTSKPKQSDLKMKLKRDGSTTITLSLPRTHVYGYTKLKGVIELVSTQDDRDIMKETAYLIGDKEGARVEAALFLPKGQYVLSTIFEGRKTETKLHVDGTLK